MRTQSRQDKIVLEKQFPDKEKYISCKVGYFSIAFKIF